jgi:hypothetical protein
MSKVYPEYQRSDLDQITQDRISTIHAVRDRIAAFKGSSNSVLDEVATYINSLDQGGDPSKSLNEKLNILVMIEDIRPYEASTTLDNMAHEESKIAPIAFSRNIIALEDNKTELKKVYLGQSSNIEDWVAIYLRAKLAELAPNNSRTTDFINTLHLPAMLRLFGATNTRLDVIDMGQAGVIDVVPHGSHVTLANTVGGEQGILARTKQSIQDLSHSRVRKDLQLNKESFGIGDIQTDTYLATYVSDIDLMNRDKDVIGFMREAISKLNGLQTPTYIYNNIAIQSGFALFEDFFLNEAHYTLQRINEKTQVVIGALDKTGSDKVSSRKALLQAVNAAYNDSFKKRRFHHYLSNITVNTMMVAAVVGIVMLSTFAGAPLLYLGAVAGALLLGQITAKALLQRPVDKQVRPSLRQILFSSSVVFTAVMMALAISIPALTTPFSLPLLAVVTFTAGAAALMLVAWDYRANRMPADANNTYFAALQSLNVGLNFDIHDMGCQEGKDRTGAVLMMRETLMTFYAENGRMPNMQDRNYLITVRFAALAITAVALGALSIFGLPFTGPVFLAVASVGAAVAIGATFAQKMYPLPKQSDIQAMGAILSTVILSDRDAQAAGRNTKGGNGMKHLDAYLPKALLANLTDKASEKIASYKEATRNFGVPGIERDIHALKSGAYQKEPAQTLELAETPVNGAFTPTMKKGSGE